MDCSELTKGLMAADCNSSATAGLEGDVTLVNFNDVDKSESVVVNNVITDFIMKEGKQGYSFSTFDKSFDDAGATFVKGTYRNTWQHNLPLRIFVKNEDVKRFVNEFGAGAKVIAIVNNKESGETAEVKYEAYGWDNGIELNESTNTVAMTDGVVYTLTLGSSDTAQEGSLPKSVFKTDLATTETMIGSIVNPTPPQG